MQEHFRVNWRGGGEALVSAGEALDDAVLEEAVCMARKWP